MKIDPLFVGLTRPSMIFGVSLKFAVLNILISMLIFINTTSIYVIFFALIAHSIGYVICFREPRFVEIYMNYLNKCTKCSNRLYHKGNSYNS